MAVNDFKARVLRVNQIVNSGSTSADPLLVYGLGSATNASGGFTASHFVGTGSDVWMFISGTQRSAGSAGSYGAVAFKGDVVVSGVLQIGEQASAASTPSTDKGAIYAVTGNLFFKNDSGAESNLLSSSAGGSNQQVQFNDNGNLAGSAWLTYDNSINTLVLTGSFIHGNDDGGGSIAYDFSHAEGQNTSAIGIASHAEGVLATASGDYSHAEGSGTTASGESSHAEGRDTVASANYSHAEGFGSAAAAPYSHAAGRDTVASGSYSYVGGQGTISSGSYQHVIGKFNKRNNSSSIFVIGDGTGTSDATRSDILRVNSGSSIGTGRVEVTGAIAATLGFTGSLTKLVTGGDYLVAGTNITLVTGALGDVTISSTAGGGAPGGSNAQVQYNNDGAFGAKSTFTFATGSDRLSVTHLSASTITASFISPGSPLVIRPQGNSTVAGSDVFFYVSGSDLTDLSVFGGRVVASGTIQIKNSSNIGAVTLTPLGYISGAGDAEIGGKLTVGGNVLINGDLFVTGTTTTINTENLIVKDPIIVMGTGSAGPNREGGIVIFSGSSDPGGSQPDLVFGRVANDTWGSGRMATNNGSVNSLSSMTLAKVRASEFEVNGATNSLKTVGSFLTVSASSTNGVLLQHGSSVNGKVQFNENTTSYLIFNRDSVASPNRSVINAGAGYDIQLSGSRIMVVGGPAGGASSTMEVWTGGPAGNPFLQFNSSSAGAVITAASSNKLRLESAGQVQVSGSEVSIIGVLTGSTSRFNQFTGSLTKLATGGDYLIAGTNITLVTGALGSVTISSTAGGSTPGGSNAQVQYNNDGAFGAKSTFTFATGSDRLSVTHLSASTITASFISPGSPLVIRPQGSSLLANSDTFFFVSGSETSDITVFGGRIVSSGSIRLKNNLSVENVQITPDGIISGSGALTAGGAATLNNTLNVVGLTTLNVLTASGGVQVKGPASPTAFAVTDAGGGNNRFVVDGINGNVSGSGTLQIASSVTIGGSDLNTIHRVTGSLVVSNGMSGSHTRLSNGNPAFVAGTGASIAFLGTGEVQVRTVVTSSTFNVAGTYTVSIPTGSLFATIELCGGGGGGGAGQSINPYATNIKGGAGGQGGNRSFFTYQTSQLISAAAGVGTITVVVGGGGGGGTGGAAPSNGTNGTVGSNTTAAANAITVGFALGGGGGQSGGNGGNGITNQWRETGGSGGKGGDGTTGPGSGGQSGSWYTGGGGGGGGPGAGPTSNNGGPGGEGGNKIIDNVNRGGSSGTSPGGAGGNATLFNTINPVGGAGGGGGASNSGGNGGKGGDGSYGGGGGGGGAAQGTGGNGGKGGDGWAIVTFY